MTTTARQTMLVITRGADMNEGYEKGRLWYFSGEREDEPDEEYLIANLMTLHENGCFQVMSNIRWHVGFLLGMVSARLIPD